MNEWTNEHSKAVKTRHTTTATTKVSHLVSYVGVDLIEADKLVKFLYKNLSSDKKGASEPKIDCFWSEVERQRER